MDSELIDLHAGSRHQHLRIWERPPTASSEFVVNGSNPIPITCTAFEDTRGEALAAGTSRGDVYVLHLQLNRFRIRRAGTHAVESLAFVSGGKELAVALSSCQIVCLNVSTGDVVATLPREHALPPVLRSASGSSLLLSLSPERAILFETSKVNTVTHGPWLAP